MMTSTMQILSNQNKAKQHFLFGNILLLQITPMLGKAAPRMQCARFVTKASVDAAPPEQIASFFDQNDISYNVADSSSFACMIEKGIKYAKQNPLQSYTALSENGYQDLLDQAYKSIE